MIQLHTSPTRVPSIAKYSICLKNSLRIPYQLVLAVLAGTSSERVVSPGCRQPYIVPKILSINLNYKNGDTRFKVIYTVSLTI